MRKHWDIQPSIFDCNGSSRVNEYGLEAVQGSDERESPRGEEWMLRKEHKQETF